MKTRTTSHLSVINLDSDDSDKTDSDGDSKDISPPERRTKTKVALTPRTKMLRSRI